MAGVQGSALAIAVCEAGGLGSLPMAMLSPEKMRAEVAAVRVGTSRPFNVNFFCHAEPAPDPGREAEWRATLAPYYRELGLDVDAIPAGPVRRSFDADAADVVLELRPPVVSFHFGLPSKTLLDVVRRAGAAILSTATTVEEARWLEHRGVHGIIAQGLEAGGHRGHFLSDDLSVQVGTIALVPQIARVVRVPVIAAGGIADAPSLSAALSLGASAVQVGTSYLLCPEATTNPVHRAALEGDAARHTALTNLFTGRPARGIVNRIMREMGAMSNVAPHFPMAGAAIMPLRAAAEHAGRGDFSPLWAGQNASGCRAAPAAEITRGLAEGL